MIGSGTTMDMDATLCGYPLSDETIRDIFTDVRRQQYLCLVLNVQVFWKQSKLEFHGLEARPGYKPC